MLNPGTGNTLLIKRTAQQKLEGIGASLNRQHEFVDGDAIRDGQCVDAAVRRVARQQFPQHYAVAKQNQ